MKKDKEPDKLSQDATAAIAAGMSYGKWKAMQDPVKPPERNPFAHLEEKKKTSTCLWCGKTFIQSRNGKQLYCELYCQRQANNDRKNKRKAERKMLLDG